MPSCSPRLLFAKLHTNLTLDGSTSSPRVLSIAFAKRSMLSIQHSVEYPQPATPRVLKCWADPTGSVSTLTLRRKPSMDSIVRKCAPVNLQCAPANVWLSKSIWVRLVAAPVVTLGHGPPNRICPQLLVPRSAKSFATTLSNATESASRVPDFPTPWSCLWRRVLQLSNRTSGVLPILARRRSNPLAFFLLHTVSKSRSHSRPQ